MLAHVEDFIKIAYDRADKRRQDRSGDASFEGTYAR